MCTGCKPCTKQEAERVCHAKQLGNILFRDNLFSYLRKKNERGVQSKVCPRQEEIFGPGKTPKFSLLQESRAYSSSTKVDEKLVKVASSMLQEAMRHLKDGKQGGVKVAENKREA